MGGEPPALFGPDGLRSCGSESGIQWPPMAARRQWRSPRSASTAPDRCRAMAPKPPITLRGAEGNGNRRRCSLRAGRTVSRWRGTPKLGIRRAPTPLQLMPIVSHSMIVSRERIATLIGLFVRMLGSRPTSLELAVQASGSRAFLGILHVLSHFAMLLCRKLFVIWSP
jgi:hypothetical protein